MSYVLLWVLDECKISLQNHICLELFTLRSDRYMSRSDYFEVGKVCCIVVVRNIFTEIFILGMVFIVNLSLYCATCLIFIFSILSFE
jgi:hypothetical protein